MALPRENEAVLLGAAVLGSVAAKKYPSVRDAMAALNAPGLVSNLLSLLFVSTCIFKLEQVQIASNVEIYNHDSVLLAQIFRS